MRRFILARAGHALGVTALVVVLTFVLARLAPGDPMWAMDDPNLSAAARDEMRARWGYDEPVWKQFVLWGANFVRGDLGWSHSYSKGVGEVLAALIPNTLLLMVPGIIAGIVLGVAIGTWQAVNRGRVSERIVDRLTLAFVSVPDFVVAVVALLIFAVALGIAPVGGMRDQVMHSSMSGIGKIGDILAHLMLPAATLSVVVAASLSRYHRTAVEGVLHEDFIRTARSKGATERRVVYRHALRNALGPVITIGGLLLPTLFTGAVFIEKIFAWPGVGLELVNAVARRDYAVVQAIVFIGTVMVTFAAAASDVLAALVNPRVRLDT